MAFKEFIFGHFPHRWLKIKKEGTKKLFTGLGNIFDIIEEYVQIPVRNNSTRSAVEALPDLENEYGIEINPSSDIDLRRARIIMKKRMIDCPITKPVLISIFEAIGVKINIVNYYNDSIMVVTITDNAYSISFKEIISILHENIRAHVGFEAEFPVDFSLEIYTGVHILIQNEYNFEFLPFDNKIDVNWTVYNGNIMLLDKEINLVCEG